MNHIAHVDRDMFTLYIGRGGGRYERSKWANDFIIGVHGDRQQCINLYREKLKREIAAGRITIEELAALDGETFGCHCKPKPCHGYVLAEFVQWAKIELQKRKPLCAHQ